ASVRMGVNPEINALASIILLVVGGIGLIAWWFMARTEKQRLKEIRKAAGG
ncbi:MAG: putrescine ABC transporter permease PotI, partial [Enterobacterales bacterium]|nr:putrescine ABC transporter permease PotI [Enterobacterales bacterium]